MFGLTCVPSHCFPAGGTHTGWGISWIHRSLHRHRGARVTLDGCVFERRERNIVGCSDIIIFREILKCKWK